MLQFHILDFSDGLLSVISLIDIADMFSKTLKIYLLHENLKTSEQQKCCYD